MTLARVFPRSGIGSIREIESNRLGTIPCQKTLSESSSKNHSAEIILITTGEENMQAEKEIEIMTEIPIILVRTTIATMIEKMIPREEILNAIATEAIAAILTVTVTATMIAIAIVTLVIVAIMIRNMIGDPMEEEIAMVRVFEVEITKTTAMIDRDQEMSIATEMTEDETNRRVAGVGRNIDTIAILQATEAIQVVARGIGEVMIDVVAVAVVVAIEARVEATRNEGNDTAVSGRKTKRSATEEETTRRGITSDLERIVSIITVEKTATREEIANGIDSYIQSKLKSRRLN